LGYQSVAWYTKREPDPDLFSLGENERDMPLARGDRSPANRKSGLPVTLPCPTDMHVPVVAVQVDPCLDWDTVHALGYNALKRGTQYIDNVQLKIYNLETSILQKKN
jgi:hypothetical protein